MSTWCRCGAEVIFCADGIMICEVGTSGSEKVRPPPADTSVVEVGVGVVARRFSIESGLENRAAGESGGGPRVSVSENGVNEKESSEEVDEC